ncbi:MAG: hypothetical protein Alpg2KO_22620 [Alphaproteobacteria bacterium]
MAQHVWRNATLQVETVGVGRNRLALRYSLAGEPFQTSIWYEGVDFISLRTQLGTERFDSLLFHITAFEANRFISLGVTGIDWGPYARFVTERFAGLWRKIAHNVWAQWRYENDLPDHKPPAFDVTATSEQPRLRDAPDQQKLLNFCGGGKDSLAAMALMEKAETGFDTLCYASSIYGRLAPQLDLATGLAKRATPGKLHRMWIMDDLMDSPVLELTPDLGIETLCAAETPASLFAVLPLVLTHGYTDLVLGHERSADAPQVIWDKTGEPINHQWGKSGEAEDLLNSYLAEELVPGLSYWSILKPVNDVTIFNMLPWRMQDVAATHSCNIEKPWCCKCPKCAYVWLGYQAWLGPDVTDPIFSGRNLFDVTENLDHFQRLSGGSDRLPFECIGEQPESLLAMALARGRGLEGAALDEASARMACLKPDDVLAAYAGVDMQADTAMPADLAQKFEPWYREAAARAHEQAAKLLQPA